MVTVLLEINRIIQPDNVWLWLIPPAIFALMLTWFLIKLFLALFFGGKVLTRIALIHKKFDSNDVRPVAEPKIWRK